jgi:hypothetical protein
MKCGVGKGRRGSIGPIVWEMRKLQPQIQRGTAALFDNWSRQFAWHYWEVCDRQAGSYARQITAFSSLHLQCLSLDTEGQSALRQPVVTQSRRPCQNFLAPLANYRRTKRGFLLQSLWTTILEIGAASEDSV